MIAVLLIVVPLLAGLASFFFKNEKAARAWALFSSFVTLGVSLLGFTLLKDANYLSHHSEWMQNTGSSFSVGLDGLSKVLTLLTAVCYPIIFLGTWNSTYKKANNFFALMLLAQAGLMGVFLATDALLFYFFWELALIPVYFLCSQWGGERRIAVTFKFFIYTFLGSVLMLIGILYIYSKTADQSFSLASFYNAEISYDDQNWLFWLFFIAFAIKMPIFPFHTWQPDTYEQSPAATTMVLSGLMVKMGLFGLLRWVVFLFPLTMGNWSTLISSLCVIGIIYASLIAIKQDDLKRLVAYSSIAHIGLMCLAIFGDTKIGLQGVMVQMFNHGINIIGLWIIIEVIEKQFGTRKMSELGGLAQKAPALAIFFVIIALANIALPLTNAFIGEFMMFNGVFDSHVYDGSYTLFGTIKMNAKNFAMLYTVLAGIGIILAAVYTLNMIRKVLYGNMGSLVESARDIKLVEKIALAIIVIFIFWMGVNPQPVLNLTNDFTDIIIDKTRVIPYINK
ncbi:MAG: NADH-quinone oxidoreductase subunit M [Chitinophagaceae bacterium]